MASGAVFRRLYLRAEEDAALRLYAESHDTSLNYVSRLALRVLVGLPVSTSVLDELYDRLQVERGRRAS